jgi:site-specific recombinase XerD
MVKAPTDAPEDTATAPDLLLNLADWPPHLRSANRSATTIRGYVDGVKRLDEFLAAKGMPRAVRNIRREHTEAFIADQLERLKPASALNRYRTLRVFFGWLVDEDVIDVNPIASQKPPSVPVQPPPILRPDDINKLRKVTSGTSFDDRRDRAIIEMFYESGMRRAELVGLKVADVDSEMRRVQVLGKGGFYRTCLYDDATAKALGRYRRMRDRHPHARSSWLWLGKKGKLTESGVAQILNRRGIEAGLGKINPHRLRHTAAHERMADGLSEGDVMMLFGWRSPAMPKRYGASAAAERAEAAYRAVMDRKR